MEPSAADEMSVDDALSSTDVPLSPPSTASEKRSNRITRRVERSCVMCHRRKVRCDKKLPCSTCTRGGVICCYPSTDRPPPRQPKSTISDIASRLGQLERTLVAISSDAFQAPRSGSEGARGRTPESDSRGPSDEVPSSRASSVDELLVEQGSSSRYINEILLSRVLEEEQEIQSVMATPCSDPTVNEQIVQPMALLGLFPASLADSDIKSLYPNRYQATQLWNVFVRNLDPVSKVLHIPTTQVDLFTVINNGYETTPDMHCLMFAVFFSATTSLSPDATSHLLGKNKAKCLNAFKQGLEMSLARSNLLDTPTIKALQALALFLQLYRAHTTGRSVWILAGLVIRAAQSIGLHRDPSKFGIPPLEAEIRRRLWWYINAHDHRSAEDHGIVLSGRDFTTDCQLPLNINDSALHAGMTTLPPAHNGWTEVTLSLCMYEMSMAMQQWHRILYAADTKVNEEKRKEVTEGLHSRIERLLEGCSPVVPIQRATMILARIVMRKLDFISRQQLRSVLQPQGDICTDETLLDSVEIMELNVRINTDELLTDFAWMGEVYPQYHTLLYVLWHLSIHPTTPHADRAWAAVNGSFEQEKLRQERQAQMSTGAKWAVLEALRAKAERARSVAIAKFQGHDVPVGDSQHDTGFGKVSPSALTNETLVESMRMNLNWDTGFFDWDSLVDDFTGNGYAYGTQ